MRAAKVVRRRDGRPAPVVVRPDEIPADLSLERTLLGTLLHEPGETLRRVRALVEPRDFAAPYHEAIWRAALDLDARGIAAEWFAVEAELVRTERIDRLRAVGGSDYAATLSGAASVPSLAPYVAEQIAARAHARRVTYAAAEIAARGRLGGDPIAFAAEARALFDEANGSNPAASWPTWEDLVEAVGYDGPRLFTGIPSLDAHTEGLPRGTIVVLGGAAGAGKTGLALQWLRRWTLEGIPTAMLCADQPAARIFVRWGQMDGLDRQAIESRDRSTLAELRERRPDVAPLLVDATKGPVHLDTVSQELRRRREALRAPISVLVADSLQTMDAGAPDDADQRTRVELAVAACKRAAERDGHVVIVTSELVKASYRSKATADQVDDRAAFADSRAQLHAADVAIVLRTPETGGRVTASIPKSRLGSSAPQPFHLEPDRLRSSFVEVEPDEEQDASDEDERRAAAINALRDRIVRVIAVSPVPLRTVDDVVRRVKARRQAVGDALKELEQHHRIVRGHTGYTLPETA